MKLKINESLNRLFESADDLDERAYRAYKERDLDFFSNLSDEELEQLKELCQITKENPYGKPYDDEVFDAIAERVYTVHSGYNPDRYDTETFKDFDSAVSYAFKLYNKYGEAHFIPPKKVSEYGAVVTGSENPETDYDNIEEFSDNLKNFFHINEYLKEETETISPSPMYAYLVNSDMTGMTFAMIHKDKERVTNQTGQRMFREWLTDNHYDDETGELTDEYREIVKGMHDEGYYLGWDEASSNDHDWVEITDWDWNDDEEQGPQSGWTVEIDGQVIPLEIVGRYHTRF